MSDRGEAERLADHPLLNKIFDELERDAMENGVYAKSDDDVKRREAMHQVRAIRDVREELKRRAAPPVNRAD